MWTAQEGQALSEREVQCLLMTAQDLTMKEIALKLGLAFLTVKHYITHARIKLGARTTTGALGKYLAGYDPVDPQGA